MVIMKDVGSTIVNTQRARATQTRPQNMYLTHNTARSRSHGAGQQQGGGSGDGEGGDAHSGGQQRSAGVA